MSKRGRNSKYTPERVKKIVEALRLGVPRRHAARYAGISEDTLLLWVKRYSDFSAQVEEAEAVAVTTWLAVINQAAKIQQDWKAAAWLLERRQPELFGPNRVDLAASGEIKIIIVDQTTTQQPEAFEGDDHDDLGALDTI